MIGQSINTNLDINKRIKAIKQLVKLEKIYSKTIKTSVELDTTNPSSGIDDEKTMDPIPPNPVMMAGADTYKVSGAEDLGHGR